MHDAGERISKDFSIQPRRIRRATVVTEQTVFFACLATSSLHHDVPGEARVSPAAVGRLERGLARSSEDGILVGDSADKSPYRLGRPQVMHSLVSGLLCDELPISRCQFFMTEAKNSITVEGAAPHGAVFWPSLWRHDKTLYEAFRHPRIVREER